MPLAFKTIRAIFHPLWVRKLTGKPAFFTSADCESEARRIHSDYDADLPALARSSNAVRIQSDLPSPDWRIASLITLFSSGETRACMRIPRTSDFGSFGLPILGFIKYFVYDENNR